MANCEPLLHELRTQLARSFSVVSMSHLTEAAGCLIETPFRYPDDRIMTIFVNSTVDGSIELSDDGYAHMYARISGVSKDVLTRTAEELNARYGVDAAHGEVVATTSNAGLLNALIAVIGASHDVAETVQRRVVKEQKNRLDRQIERTLVVHGRSYERRARLRFVERPVDVDYNVLPTNELSQLSLFSLNHKTSLRGAESIAHRLNLIARSTPLEGGSTRVLVISDESASFGTDGETWRLARETIRETGARILPITRTEAIAEALAA